MNNLLYRDANDLDFVLNHPNLNEEHLKLLIGGGFASDIIQKIKKTLSPCICYTKSASKIIEEFGNYEITALQIYRTPLNKMIDFVVNAFTLGYWNNTMKQFGFDRFFHLALVATIKIKQGNDFISRNIIIEKNEVINVSTSYRTQDNTETYNISLGTLPKRTTIRSLLDRTRKRMGDDRYFLYDAFSNNCQYFVKNILEANNVLTTSAEKFLFQDIRELASALPSLLKKTARTITDIAGTTAKLTGRGKAKKNYKEILFPSH